jgi:hypothetical protein
MKLDFVSKNTAGSCCHFGLFAQKLLESGSEIKDPPDINHLNL